MDAFHTPDGSPPIDGSPVSQRLVHGDVAIDLHDDTNLAVLSCLAPTKLNEGAARAFVPEVAEWMERIDGRIHVLVDCTKLAGSDAAWRSILFEALSPHRSRLRIAWFGMNSLVTITAKMFITALSATGVFDGAIFKDRQSALQWLERDRA